MPVLGTIHRALIASPNDVKEERVAIRDAINDWNSQNSYASSMVIVPIMWESDSHADSGGPPQSILNNQIVKWSDFGIACFWTTPGTETKDHEGGTAEEIFELMSNGKTVMVYFCNRDISQEVAQTESFKRLLEYKEKMSSSIYYKEFEDVSDLKAVVQQDLALFMNKAIGRNDSGVVRRNKQEPEYALNLRIALKSIEEKANTLKLTIEIGKQNTFRNADKPIDAIGSLERSLIKHVGKLNDDFPNIDEVRSFAKDFIVRVGDAKSSVERYNGGQISDPNEWVRLDEAVLGAKHLVAMLKESIADRN